MIRTGTAHAFVGRSFELSRMLSLLSTAASGSARAVLVGGEAGIGKTRLVQELTRHATDRGARVLSGACRSLGQVPYTPIVDALRRETRAHGVQAVRDLAGADADALGALLPSLCIRNDQASSPVSQGRIFEAVLRLLDQAGNGDVGVLILEDLHWADASTLELVGFLFGALSTEQVLVVGTYRTTDLGDDHPMRSALPALSHAASGGRLELGGLADDDFDRLIGAILGESPSPELLEHLRGRCDGNPFYAEELLVAAPSGGATVPSTVREHMQFRIDTLDARSRQVLDLISVAGHRVTQRFLARTQPDALDDLDAALARVVATNLLTVDQEGTGYAFRHALAREAVYQQLLPGHRMRLHAVVAETLELDRPGNWSPAAELAFHWWEADRPREAMRWCVQAAGDAAAVFGYAEAARYYQQALNLWSRLPDPESAAGLAYQDLLSLTADARRWTGDITDAVQLIERATEQLDSGTSPERLAELLDRQGRYLWELADSEGSLMAYRRACQVLEGQPDSPIRAWVLAGHATALMQAGRHTPAIGVCRQALAVAERTGADHAVGRALNTLGVCLALTGDPDEGIVALRRATEIAGRAGRLEDIDRAYANLTYVLESAGRLEEALAVAREGSARTTDLGVQMTGGGVLLANTASVLVLLGQWEEACLVADQALGRPLPAAFTQYLKLVSAEVDIAQGRFDAATQRLAAIGEGPQEPQVAGTSQALRAELALWRGEPADAVAAVDLGLLAMEATEEHALVLRLCALGLRATADRDPVLADSGAGDAAGRRYLDRIDACGERSPLPEVNAMASLCRLEHDRLTGRHAAKEWSGLGSTWQAMDRPYPAGYAWWRAAEDAVADRDTVGATSNLQNAHRLASQLGAVALLGKVDELAARARIPLSLGPKESRRSRRDPDGLTIREREVLNLLAEGLTNRQIAKKLFIAERTAGVHVSNILTKLGVPNRSSAAAHVLRGKPSA